MENNFFEQVGNNIQKILEEKSYTQQFLASNLNISKQVMSKIIGGGKSINVAEITSIANILDVPVNRLLEVSNDEVQSHSFSFMGKILNKNTREKVELLSNIIDEILLLEEYANAK